MSAHQGTAVYEDTSMKRSARNRNHSGKDPSKPRTTQDTKSECQIIGENVGLYLNCN
jgi:hypothetical protein